MHKTVSLYERIDMKCNIAKLTLPKRCFDMEQQESFDKVKQLLTVHPVLTLFDPDKSIHLFIFVCLLEYFGMGCSV